MNTFFIIFLGIPAIEIFLLIKIGGKIGALNTIALIFLTAIIGIYYARLQGIQTLRSGITSLYQNKAPIYEIISGASIAVAALLLIIPGFLTDTVGFLLLIPLSRNILFKLALKNKKMDKKSEERKINDKINTKIVLATIIEMDSQNFKKTEIEKIVLIDVPSQIYGEIRKIFISLFESSGFKDIKINEKIDFKKLYDLKKSQ